FSLAGSAAQTGSDTYTLIPGNSGAAGGIWHPVDLSQDAAWHARLFFGPGGPGAFTGKADGVTFAFQNTAHDAIGGPGNDLGIANGVSDAVGVKFDTFLFSGENPAQFFAGGDVNANPGLSAQPVDESLTDGSWHDVVIAWNATTHQLAY